MAILRYIPPSWEYFSWCLIACSRSLGARLFSGFWKNYIFVVLLSRMLAKWRHFLSIHDPHSLTEAVKILPFLVSIHWSCEQPTCSLHVLGTSDGLKCWNWWKICHVQAKPAKCSISPHSFLQIHVCACHPEAGEFAPSYWSWRLGWIYEPPSLECRKKNYSIG